MLCRLEGDTRANKKEEIPAAYRLLSEKLNDLTGMDLNVTNEAFFEKDYAYWLIVCTDSLCLHGSDIYFRKEVPIEGMRYGG
ncbi:MAG: hypothetical protein JXA95_17265 [Spirochaetales bacterium]|nr:hypothetical protein [Spirochaetales bacterium]